MNDTVNLMPQAPADWREYREWAWTHSQFGPGGTSELAPPVRLAYLAMGLVGETGEFLDELEAMRVVSDKRNATLPELVDAFHAKRDKLNREAVDVLWYFAMIERHTGHEATWDKRSAYTARSDGPPWENGGVLVTLSTPLERTTARIAELAKRPLIGREMDAARLHAELDTFATSFGLVTRPYATGERLVELSREKIAARFPAGYSVAAADRAIDKQGGV